MFLTETFSKACRRKLAFVPAFIYKWENYLEIEKSMEVIFHPKGVPDWNERFLKYRKK